MPVPIVDSFADSVSALAGRAPAGKEFAMLDFFSGFHAVVALAFFAAMTLFWVVRNLVDEIARVRQSFRRLRGKHTSDDRGGSARHS